MRRAIGPGIKRPVGHHRHRQPHGVQRGHQIVAARFEFTATTLVLGDRVGLKASQRGVLSQAGRADVEVLRQFFHRADDALGDHQPTQAPAGHVEVFGEAVDGNHLV